MKRSNRTMQSKAVMAVVIKNRWRTILNAKGITQADAASMAGIAPSVFSGVVNGSAVLEYDDLTAACAALKTEPSNVYDAELLSVLYGVEQKKKERTVVNVQLYDQPAELFLMLKSAYGCETNAELLKLMLECEYDCYDAVKGDKDNERPD